MRIWEIVKGPRKETKEEKLTRLRYNERKHDKNKIRPPVENKQKRFAKNRQKFYITLNDGSEWEIEDTSSTDPNEEKGGLSITITELFTSKDDLYPSRSNCSMYVDVSGSHWNGILLVSKTKKKEAENVVEAEFEEKKK